MTAPQPFDENRSAVLDAVDDVLLRIEVSDDPRVVFAGLVEACVPGFSDACEVSYDVAAGPPDPDRVPGCDRRHEVRTAFGRSPHDPGPDYGGVVVHRFIGGPFEPLVVSGARIIVDRAVSVITQVRLAGVVRPVQDGTSP